MRLSTTIYWGRYSVKPQLSSREFAKPLVTNNPTARIWKKSRIFKGFRGAEWDCE
jgi:hypothetical protein